MDFAVLLRLSFDQAWIEHPTREPIEEMLEGGVALLSRENVDAFEAEVRRLTRLLPRI